MQKLRTQLSHDRWEGGFDWWGARAHKGPGSTAARCEGRIGPGRGRALSRSAGPRRQTRRTGLGRGDAEPGKIGGAGDGVAGRGGRGRGAGGWLTGGPWCFRGEDGVTGFRRSRND